ncbi:MAG: HDOD domain-containing protein [Candidatus Latescibacteria bacterium]|jgi:HD-like signal output (HDOD) protein|nr:HDOD domain-containing protein [Candidatus Latescibacterota bacterium]
MLNFFRRREKDPRKELRKLLGEYELPSFPAVVMNVLNALRDPEFSMKEVAGQLQMDPGLHVKVLKTVNSAAFGLSSRVNNLHHAVTLLGRSRLETIVLSQAIGKSLPTVNMPFFDMNKFWFSSAKRASMARILAHHFHPATQVESFTIGLLQDMGLPVLVKAKQNDYRNIFERWSAEKEILLQVFERETLGYDHITIGGLMAEEWRLPENLVKAISTQADQDEMEHLEPAAKLILNLRGRDDSDDLDILVNKCMEEHGMNQDMILKMLNNALEDAEELSNILK